MTRPADSVKPGWCDPAFILGAEQGLQLSARARSRIEPPLAWRWLAMRVARQPLDLRAHTQRIALLADCGEPTRLFSALVDLFLVLGDKGRALRAELLERARAVLDPEDHAYLLAQLDSGLARNAMLPLAHGSVLARGVIGSTAMVSEQAEERPVHEHDPYDDPFHVPPGAEA